MARRTGRSGENLAKEVSGEEEEERNEAEDEGRGEEWRGMGWGKKAGRVARGANKVG